MSKKILHFVMEWLIITFGFSLIFALVFSAYQTCATYVVGTELSFDFSYLINGFLISFPACFCFASLFMVYYRIRHNSRDLCITITYVILGFYAWFAAIPAHYYFSENANFSMVALNPIKISSDYFRKEDKGIYYYSKVNEDGSFDGLLYSEKNPVYNNSVEVLNNEHGKDDKAFGGDSLIRNSLSDSKLLNVIMSMFAFFYDIIKDFLETGYLAYLLFGSISIPLLCVGGLRLISSWKLINVFYCTFAFISILLVNYFYYKADIFIHVFKKTAISTNYVYGELIGQVILNIVISIVIGGIDLIAYYRLKAKEEEQELI